MADLVHAAFRGIETAKRDLAKIASEEDRATRRAMVRSSARLRSQIRANTPVRTTNLTRQPPPGDTRRHVHTLRPRRVPGGWTGKVSAMGGRQNFYVSKLEQRYGFLARANAGFDAKAAFEEEWLKAFRR